MKLAIICGMPKSKQTLGGNIPVIRLPDIAPGESVTVDLEIHEPDLSASAEQSAKDAFAYCQGPFGEMEFVRATDKAAFDSAIGSAHWILFMAHDCLVDIQAFELFGETLDDYTQGVPDMIRFSSWTTGGFRLGGISGKYSFQRTPFTHFESAVTAIGRILIEPEGEPGISVSQSGTHRVDVRISR